LAHTNIYEEVLSETANKWIFFSLPACGVVKSLGTALDWDPLKGFSDSGKELWVS
jgi:hypothetical protein